MDPFRQILDGNHLTLFAHLLFGIGCGFHISIITNLDQQHGAQIIDHLVGKLTRIRTAIQCLMQQRDTRIGFVLNERTQHINHLLVRGGAKHRLGKRHRYRISGRGDLVEQRDGISQTSGRLAGDQRECIRFILQFFLVCDLLQQCDDVI